MQEIDPNLLSRSGTNWLAFSGGPDSACLLHLLTRAGPASRIRVVHIDHGLDEQSGERARRAADIAAGMGMDCRLERLTTEQLRGAGGPEAAARHARYSQLQSLMQPGDHVLTAHHADDQVETVMLRLLRGAGPTGLSGMRALRRLGPGWLGRPLLAWRRDEILEYVQHHCIDYLSDPTNRDISLDRNYLRHRVLPEIGRRWPGYRSSVLQSSRWQRAAARSLDEEAQRNLERLRHVRTSSGEKTLAKPDWLALDTEKAFATIRAWCLDEDLGPPPVRSLREFHSQCATADRDRQPALDWPDGSLRAWRGMIWLDRKPEIPVEWCCDWPGGDRCTVPAGGRLVWSGLKREEIGRHWRIQGPPPGARIRLHLSGPARPVNELLREAGIPPWRRHAFPVLSIDGTLCAVGVEWLAPDFAGRLTRSGSRLEWQQRPPALLP